MQGAASALAFVARPYLRLADKTVLALAALAGAWSALSAPKRSTFIPSFIEPRFNPRRSHGEHSSTWSAISSGHTIMCSMKG
jgi:hypothetical protein